MNTVAIFGIAALAFAFYIVGMHFGAVKRILFLPVLFILGGWLSYYYSFHKEIGTGNLTYLAVALWTVGSAWCLFYVLTHKK